MVVLVDENLRALLRGYRQLNRVGTNLAERQARGDVHVGRRQKSVREIVNGIDIETRAALIRMLRVFLWSQQTIFDRIETHIEKRARVRARAQISSKAESAF